MGQDFLKRNFGVTPKYAWQLDPFGHSSSMPKIFKELGFEAVFFGRMDDSLKQEWIRDQDLTLMWNPTFEGISGTYNGGPLFTNVLYRTYLPPCDLPAGDYWNPNSLPRKFGDTTAKIYREI